MILHIIWSGKGLQLLCILVILPFGMLCLSAISMIFVKLMLVVCMLVGMVVSPLGFLVVSERPSVML